jgi:hypothetical protein
MIVHFTSARANVANELPILRKIVSVIHKTGNVIARDWIEPQHATKAIEKLDPEEVYQLHMDAIERADLVVIEASYKSFGLGFQAAVALQKKKPTLLLIEKSRTGDESIIAKGMIDPLLTRKEYGSEEMLESVVEEFIVENTVKTKDLRFNFVLDPQLYNHIRWKSFKARKTKAEVVRDLLLKDMEETSR